MLMRTSVAVAFSSVLFALVSCSPRSTPASAADPTFSSAAYCRVAGLPGLYDWTGSAFVTCPGLMPGQGDAPIDGSTCSASSVAADGSAQATTLINVQSAQAMSDGRLIVWSFDGSLSIHQAGMAPHTIAPIVLDPWLDGVRNRVA